VTTPSNAILVSGGAGYIGSHAVHALRQAGFAPIVVDSLINGHAWATKAAVEFRQGDIADSPLIRALVREFKPVAALHFAAFIEVGESVADPEKYFENNRDKAKIFFDALATEGVQKIVFSSTAAVYGAGEGLLTESHVTAPVNPYGQSKLEAETYLRAMPGVQAMALRYFNVAGAAPEAGLGEAHFPESHVIPRIVLPLIGAPEKLCAALGLGGGFKIYGDDYPTSDGSAVRDYVHVLDLAEAHVAALRHLLAGGESDVINLGSATGYSVKDIVAAARSVLNRPDFNPPMTARRPGDPAILVASGDKAQRLLGWKPKRGIAQMIESAADWHRSDTYIDTILAKAGRR
jgi:UDP-glucose-4-epimerase GalE